LIGGIRIKRIYPPASKEDGKRILVERLWPRGLKKEKAAIDRWLKEVAPSTELRRWYAHDEAKWPEFQERYRAELARTTQALDEIRRLAKTGTVTLVYAAQDEEHNSAVVLQAVLNKKI